MNFNLKMNFNMKQRTIAVVISVLCIMMLLPVQKAAAQADSDVQALAEVYQLLEQHHISGIESRELVEAAIQGMVEALNDPFSEYYSPRQMNDLVDSIEQQYVGIGIRVAITEDNFYVDEVFADTPAAEAGLRRLDHIVKVDGKSTDGWTLDQLTGAIRGPEGTEVTLTLQRDEQEIAVTISRKALTLASATSRWFGQGVGYIALTSFSLDAATQVAALLHELQEKQMTSLILDLRGNPGGYLHTAVDVAKLFIEEGAVLHMMDRSGELVTEYVSDGSKPNVHVTLLVDGGSASASEILAGALQDHGAATLIGAQTYGKGSVQNLSTLSNGGTLRFTIQQYYTPEMHPVDGVGITPDREVSGRVPQLLAALHHSGMKVIRLEAEHGVLSVNGAPMSDRIDMLNEGERVFVASRTLASIVDADIAWNGKLNHIELKQGDVSIAFDTSSAQAKLIDGVSYIELAAFAESFPGFTWSAHDDKLKLEYTKG